MSAQVVAPQYAPQPTAAIAAAKPAALADSNAAAPDAPRSAFYASSATAAFSAKGSAP